MSKHADETDDNDFLLLLNQILKSTGFDFRQYTRASLSRRLRDCLRREECEDFAWLAHKIAVDSVSAVRVASSISVPTTEMFRDPDVYREIRQEILPKFQDADVIRVWSAGCATGEESYSLTILLAEAGLLERSRVYATDLHEGIIERARLGVVALRAMQLYTKNYLRSGGTSDFSSYYTSGYDRVIFHDSLLRHITFSCHSLVSDRSFNEFDLIFCRNVMLYFDKDLRAHVHRLLFESLKPGGYLVLGDKESIVDSPEATSYVPIRRDLKLYQRRVVT